MIQITKDYCQFWSQINNDNKVIIYGAGYRTEAFSKILLKAETPWEYIIDNNIEKRNTSFCTKRVVLPKDINELYPNYETLYIVVTVNDINGALKTIMENFNNAIVLIPGIERRLNNYNDMFAPVRKKLLKRDDFTIFSNTCAGTRIYCLANTQFNTPVIASIIYPEDYLKLCQNPEHYMDKKIQFKEYGTTYLSDCLSKYPILKLDDILVHCVHSKSVENAVDDWNKRRSRFNKDNFFMIFDTLHFKPTLSVLKDFLNIPHGKKFILQYHIGQLLEHSMIVPESQGLFNVSHPVEYWFDVVGWLNNEVEY